MSISDAFMDEYEEFYKKNVEPQQDNVNIPSSEDLFGKYYGDNEPAF